MNAVRAINGVANAVRAVNAVVSGAVSAVRAVNVVVSAVSAVVSRAGRTRGGWSAARWPPTGAAGARC